MLNTQKLLSLILVVALSGCASKALVDKDAMAPAGSAANTAVTTGQTTVTADSSAAAVNNNAAMQTQTVFYFDFDQDTIRQEAYDSLKTHAKFLVEHSKAAVRLDGSTDERGTREYNLALGERRAKAVAQFLTLNGVASSQIETVSYGEEKPVALDHDEAAWAQNRRVELTYNAN